MSKFGGLSASVEEPFKVFLIDPTTGDDIVAKDGRKAFIEVLSADSEVGRDFDRRQQRRRNQRLATGRQEAIINDDADKINQQKTAILTRSWCLIDPATGEEISDFPCTKENALELYSDPGCRSLWLRVFMAANEPANFMRPSLAI